ncbi:MAG: hypothetical protein R2690_04565 [Acidimicrobiales bacterium]
MDRSRIDAPPWAALTSRQHGLVTCHQLRHLGLTPGHVDQLLRSGRFLAIERGVYLIHGAPVTWHTRLLAACLSIDGVASHRSAAALHGIGGYRPGRPELTVGRTRDGRFVGAQVHWSTDLDRVNPQRVDQIPTTPVARTILDLGAVSSRQRVHRAIDDALLRGLTSWPELLAVYETHRRQGRRGAGTLRAILAERFGDADGAESALELDLQRLLRHHGLDGFSTQVDIYDEDGFVMRADVAWTEEHTVVEADSLAFHLTPEAFRKDRRCRARARAAGWFLYEATAIDIRVEPAPMIDVVRGVLTDRGWRR